MRTRQIRAGGVLRVVALVSVAALVATACARGEEEAPPPEETTPAETTSPTAPAQAVTKIGYAAPEKANDYGWNQQGAEGAKAVAQEIGAEIEIADGLGYEDVGPVLRQLAEGGTNFIIAQASGYNTTAPQVAQEFTVPVVVYGNPDANIPGLAADIETTSQQGSYLAGIVAASMSQTGTVGIVVSADDENWTKMAGGFVAGARSVNPDVEILLAQIGPAGYADAAGGKRVTDSVIAGGADVVFGMGDGSSFGMIQSVETATPPPGADKVWFIDVIGDKTSLDEKGIYLSSVLWDFTPIFRQAVEDINAGTFGNQGYDLNVANGGIALLRTQYIPDDVWAAVEEAMAGIEDGSIEIPLTPTMDDVKALIKG